MRRPNMDAALIAGIGAVSVGAAVAGIELGQQDRMQSVELRFGRDVTPEAVKAAIDRLAGLHPGVRVVLDVCANHEGVRHFMHSDQATIETLSSGLRALMPSLRLEHVRPGLSTNAGLRYGRTIQLRGRVRALRDDLVPETSSALLAALQPLGSREQLLLRWVVRSSSPFTVPANGSAAGIESEERRRLRTKNAGGVVRARGLLAVRAGHPRRAAHLLARVNAVLRSRGTAYGRLRTSPRLRGQLSWDLSKRSFLLMDRYGSGELAGLLAWPIGAQALPGVSVGTSPQLLPSPRLPRTGQVFGTATWPGAERPVAQTAIGSTQHRLITGPTGVGKSTLLTNLIVDSATRGEGLVLLDGKGDTVSAVLERLPKERWQDVIVLDCGQAGPQPGIRLFAGSGDPELEADVVLAVLTDLFKTSWGPLSERYLRAGIVAVAHDPNGTLADVPYVYNDPHYRRELLGRLHDPLTKATLVSFEGMSAADRQNQLAASFNKLGTLLSRPIVRTVLGQSEPKLDFTRAIEKRQIVLISVSPMRVGGSASRLIGAVALFALFQAVLKRAATPESQRRVFQVFVDEPKALGDLPTPLDALFEQARGLGVSISAAPQSVTQLPRSVKDAALTNAASRVVFRQNADDARLLARDLSGVTPEDLGDLGAFEAVARIALGPGDIAPPVTIRTKPLPPAICDGAEVHKQSVKRYGVSLEDVDAGLRERHQLRREDSPIGRKRRSV
jgi:energy-coupling factor transporter ATP-binding protein EcfA2